MSSTDDLLEGIDQMLTHARAKAAYGRSYSLPHEIAREIRWIGKLMQKSGGPIYPESKLQVFERSVVTVTKGQLSPRELDRSCGNQCGALCG